MPHRTIRGPIAHLRRKAEIAISSPALREKYIAECLAASEIEGDNYVMPRASFVLIRAKWQHVMTHHDESACSCMSPIDRARLKLNSRKILVDAETVEKRKAICSSCESQKKDAAGNFAGCLRCNCSTGKIERLLPLEHRQFPNGTKTNFPCDKWPKLQLTHA